MTAPVQLPLPFVPDVPTDDDPSELTPDLVPDIDQEAPQATYRDWDPVTTRVVTYSVGGSPPSEAERPTSLWGISRDSARTDCKARFGRVYEANYVPGRAFFRVRKP